MRKRFAGSEAKAFHDREFKMAWENVQEYHDTILPEEFPKAFAP